MLIDLINNKNFSVDKLATLRCTIISGAAATSSQIKKFRGKMPNNYFLFEWNDYRQHYELQLHRRNTIGHPVKNIKIKILNPYADGIGEILV